MKKICKFDIDLQEEYFGGLVAVQQDDIRLVCNVTDGGKVVDLTNQTIVVDAIRRDGQIIRQLDGYTGTADGLLECDLCESITHVAGVAKIQITFDGYKGQASTPKIDLILQPKIILNGDGEPILPPEIDDTYIQMYKLTTDAGYSKHDTNDCDECVRGGFYYLENPVLNGFDDSNSLFLSVNAMSNAIKVQTGVSVTGKVGYRLMIAGNWKSWTTTDFEKVIEINDVNGLQTALDNKADDLELETLGKLLGTEIDLKADKSYVDVADKTLKAEIGAVESGLNLKLEEKSNVGHTHGGELYYYNQPKKYKYQKLFRFEKLGNYKDSTIVFNLIGRKVPRNTVTITPRTSKAEWQLICFTATANDNVWTKKIEDGVFDVYCQTGLNEYYNMLNISHLEYNRADYRITLYESVGVSEPPTGSEVNKARLIKPNPHTHKMADVTGLEAKITELEKRIAQLENK